MDKPNGVIEEIVKIKKDNYCTQTVIDLFKILKLINSELL